MKNIHTSSRCLKAALIAAPLALAIASGAEPVSASNAVDGKILSAADAGDISDWIEIAQSGGHSLIVRKNYINIRHDHYGDPFWQYTAFGSSNKYVGSTVQAKINNWFNGTNLSGTMDKLSANAALRDFTVKNTALGELGSGPVTSGAGIDDGFSAPLAEAASTGDNIAFALSYGEAVNFVSESYMWGGTMNTESTVVAKANFAKIAIPTGGTQYNSLWLRSPGNNASTASILSTDGRVFPQYIDNSGCALVYPALWVKSSMFNPLPAEPAAIAALTVSADTVTLSATSANTQGTWMVYSAPALTAAEDEWTPVAHATGLYDETGAFTATFAKEGGRRFYRVVSTASGNPAEDAAYSSNVGGYYTLEIPKGVRMFFANQFIQPSQQISTLFASVANSTTINFLDANGASVAAGKNTLGIWSNGTALMPTGQDFQAYNSSAATSVVLSGTLEAAVYSKALIGGATKQFCSALPLAGSPDALGIATVRSENLRQYLADGTTFYALTSPLSTNWSPSTPAIALGESFLLYYPGADRTLRHTLHIDTQSLQLTVTFSLQ